MARHDPPRRKPTHRSPETELPTEVRQPGADLSRAAEAGIRAASDMPFRGF